MILPHIVTLLNIVLIIPTCQVTERVKYTNSPYYDISIKYQNTEKHEYNIRLAPDLEINRFVMLFYHVKHSRTKPLSIPISIGRQHYKLVILIISGDVSLNPGPVKIPCGGCCKAVAKTHRAVLCEACNYWWHIKCESISPSEYNVLGLSEDPWTCNQCNTYHFSDSFFEDEINLPTSSETGETSIESIENEISVFEDLIKVRQDHMNKCIISHLNINSLKTKFIEIKELLVDKIVDFLIIAETKLDPSYRNSLFEVPGYKLERRDRDSHGGGIAAFIRSDIPARRRPDLESKTLENITYEVILNKTKWCIICIYRPPNMNDQTFSDDTTTILDKCITHYDNYMVIGDINYDLLCPNKGKVLFDIIELFDLSNLVKEPTCYMKNCTPSLLDVILTNRKSLCMRTLNFSTGISDCHNMISTVINNTIPIQEKQKISYRSFKKLDIDALNEDIANIDLPLHKEQNMNDCYQTFENEVSNIFNKHVPLKTMYRKQNQVPYMNRDLRKAIYEKKMYYSKFVKNKNPKTWEQYRVRRNYVNKLKRKSENKYFLERCTGGCKQKDFWQTIKPYFSKKGVK